MDSNPSWDADNSIIKRLLPNTAVFAGVALIQALSLGAHAQPIENSDDYQEFLEYKENQVLLAALDTGNLFDLDLQQLMDIEISIASKTPQKMLKTAGTVYIISEEDIERYGWRDLREIMAAIPAFSAIRNYDWFNVSLRGGGANMVKLLIDGREVQNLIADEAVIQESFPSHRIKRVEVLMGSHSTLYGSNAADGVINIITKHGGEDQDNINEIQITRGEANTSLLSVVMRNNFEGGHFGLSVSTFSSDYNWSELTEFAQDNDLWSRRDTLNIPDYSDPVSAPYRSYSFGFFAEMDDIYAGANVWEDSGPQGYNEVFAYWGERRSIRKFDQWFIGHNFDVAGFTGSVEYIFTDEEDLFLEPDWNGSLEPTRHHIKSEFSGNVGQHQLVLGYNGYTQSTIFRNDVGETGSSGIVHLFPQSEIHDIKTSKHSLYIHDSYDLIADRLNTVLGLSYEAHNDVDAAWVPRLGLVYTPDATSSFRMIYGGGFRAPNGFDVVNANNAGIDTLEPIESNMLELGYIQTLSEGDWLIVNNMSLYQYTIDGNYVKSQLVGIGGAPGDILIEPADSTKSWGFENMLKFEYEQASSFVSGRYSAPEKSNVAGEEIVKDIAEYKVKAGLSYQFSHSMLASIFIDHSASVKTEANVVDTEVVIGGETVNVTEVIEIPSWTTLNVNLVLGEYDWGNSHLKVTLHGENITNEEYFHPRRGISPYQIMQPPRYFRLTADMEF